MEMYFDYASTTPVDPEVLKIYNTISEKFYRNAQSDAKSKQLADEGKKKVLELLGLDDTYEVIFTSGGTESNNLAIVGAFQDKEPKHLITSTIEHPSVLESFKYLESLGHRVDYLNPDENGEITYEQIESKINDKTAMVGIMMINNEIGSLVITPKTVEKIKKNNRRIIIFSDTIQTIGKIKVNYKALDMFTISGHKIYAPAGVGILIKKKNIVLKPLFYGSSGSLRPGTQNLAGQIATVNALKKVLLNEDENIRKIEELRNYLVGKIKEGYKIKLNSKSISNIVNINLETKALGETIVEYLGSKDIYLSTRSACSSKSNQVSHVLKNIGIPEEKINKSIRISFGPDVGEEELDRLLEELNEIAVKL